MPAHTQDLRKSVRWSLCPEPAVGSATTKRKGCVVHGATFPNRSGSETLRLTLPPARTTAEGGADVSTLSGAWDLLVKGDVLGRVQGTVRNARQLAAAAYYYKVCEAIFAFLALFWLPLIFTFQTLLSCLRPIALTAFSPPRTCWQPNTTFNTFMCDDSDILQGIHSGGGGSGGAES